MRSIAMFVLTTMFFAGTAFASDQMVAGAVSAPHAPPGAKVFIISPLDGATVSEDVLVKFGVSGIELAPASEAKPGTGHHHLLIDVDGLPPQAAPIPADATHKHYGKGQSEDTIHLSPGTHTLQLDFGDAAHMQFDPPLVSKKITIHVQ